MRARRLMPLVLAGLLAACGGKSEPEQAQPPREETRPPATTAPPPTETTPAPPPATTAPPPTTTAPPVPPGPLVFPAGKGAFVWHETDIDPERFAVTLRENGFDWAAVRLHDGYVEDPLDPGWLDRYRRAGGPHLGAWGVLRDRPEDEAELAYLLVANYGLAFYIANAEAEYAYSGPDGTNGERFERSRRFVGAFRTLTPSLPAAVSSYCRADLHDLDWAAWRNGGFHFMPQAYVNDFGAKAAPGICIRASSQFFERDAVHPTIGSYPAKHAVSADDYARMLSRAAPDGFSVYLAETAMPDEAWRALGAVPG